MGEPDKAIDSFREYLQHAKNLPADQQETVEGYIRDMEAAPAHAGTERVKVDLAGYAEELLVLPLDEDMDLTLSTWRRGEQKALAPRTPLCFIAGQRRALAACVS